MAELLEVYDLDGNLIETELRDKFYEDIKREFSSSGKITKQVKTIRMLLMNSSGRVFLQKRSKIKRENPGLYDKTIGGHVAEGYSHDIALIKECTEELGFPAAVLPAEEFDRAISSVDLKILGLIRRVEYTNAFKSVRITRAGDQFIQPFMNVFYVGYYDGSIRFVDGESSGMEVFSVPELEEEINSHPEKFTDDIKYLLKHYKKLLKPIKK